MGEITKIMGPDVASDERDYLHACRRVLAAGVLARDRAEVLAIEPGRWPRAAMHLRDRIERPGAGASPQAELDLLDAGHDIQYGISDAVEGLIDTDRRLADALLRLQLDCARVRFVFEETAMRLKGDPLRFAHSASHGRLLQRLADARTCLRARRFDEARAIVSAYRAELSQHVREMDAPAENRAGGDA